MKKSKNTGKPLPKSSSERLAELCGSRTFAECGAVGQWARAKLLLAGNRGVEVPTTAYWGKRKTVRGIVAHEVSRQRFETMMGSMRKLKAVRKLSYKTRRRNRYRQEHGIPLDAPVRRGGDRKG